jgi:hypothetical protein
LIWKDDVTRWIKQEETYPSFSRPSAVDILIYPTIAFYYSAQRNHHSYCQDRAGLLLCVTEGSTASIRG